MTSFFQTFICIVIAVAVDRFFSHVPVIGSISKWRLRDSYECYAKFMEQKLANTPAWNGFAKASLLILPIPLLFTMLNWMFNEGFTSIIGLAIGGLVLYLCLDTKERHGSAPMGEKFVLMHEGLFAPIFWYFILGPFGALLYTILSILIERRGDFDSSIASVLETIHGFMAWFSSRLSAITFAFVGQYNHAFDAFKRTAIEKGVSSRQVLSQCGSAALENGEPVAAFFDRVTLFWLVAFFVISVSL